MTFTNSIHIKTDYTFIKTVKHSYAQTVKKISTEMTETTVADLIVQLS